MPEGGGTRVMARGTDNLIHNSFNFFLGNVPQQSTSLSKAVALTQQFKVFI